MPNNTKNFKVSEFSCHCACGYNVIDQRVIDMAQTIRDAIGIPIHVNSGYRCEKHNAASGGVKDSSHIKALPLICLALQAQKNSSRLSLTSRPEVNSLTSNTLYSTYKRTSFTLIAAKIETSSSR